MIQIPMSKDVKDHSPKIVAFFDRRQVICILAGAVYTLPAFLLMRSAGLDITINLTICTLLLAPVVMCGWVKMYGMPFETFFFRCMIPILLYPKKRTYETKNLFSGIEPEDRQKPGFKNAKRHKMSFREKKEYKELMQKYNSSF